MSRRHRGKDMIEPKKKDDVNIAFQDEDMGGNALKDAFQKAEQTVVKKFQEPNKNIKNIIDVDAFEPEAE
jgi:hypothetical protein